MDQLETRELAYFVSVAETCHFGRAAERLGIAQPPLSRAISRLERRLGVVLLERTSRRVSLTPAGETLLLEGRRVLEAIDTAVARTQKTAMSEPRLTLAMKPGSDGGLLPAILSAYREAPGAVNVDVRTCAAGEQPGLLRRGAADVAFMHQHQAGLDWLDSEVLLVEQQVAVLSAGHRLAVASDVCLAELEDELLPTDRLAANPSEALQLVALGRAVVVLPASLQNQIRRDVVCVPVRDAAPTELLIAWPQGRRSPALASFVHTAAKVAAAAGSTTQPPARSCQVRSIQPLPQQQ
jgi:DNA-binding transcriptional LysR family regulator